jgi:hypothetical protein
MKSFREVTTAVDGFLAPVVAAISSGMDFSRQLSRPFPPANQVPQTGSHPAHGPEQMDSHQKELIGVCSIFKNF